MKKATPTQGPWRILPEECDKPYIRIRGTRLGGRYKIANVLTPTHEGVHEREAVETRANARLIAKSPELYELAKRLQKFAKESPHFGYPPGSLQDIHQLISEIENEA